MFPIKIAYISSLLKTNFKETELWLQCFKENLS